MSNEQSARCTESVVDSSGWHWHKCGRPIHEEGKCKIHCPSAVKARAEKSQARWDAKQANSPYVVIDRLRNQNAELIAALKGLLEVADLASENGNGWRMAQHTARNLIAKAQA